VPREAGIEDHLIRCVERVGWLQLKIGYDGWPDRLVIFAPRRHFWVELKQPDGSLTPAQKVRIPKLVSAGETVFIPDTRREITELFEALR
jgi:hypothetical protein